MTCSRRPRASPAAGCHGCHVPLLSASSVSVQETPWGEMLGMLKFVSKKGKENDQREKVSTH